MITATYLGDYCHLGDPALQAVLEECGPAIAALIGPLWPLRGFEKIAYSNEFTAYQLGQLPDGRWAKLHHFKGRDRGAPHDHPCPLEVHCIKGSSVERVYYPGGTEDILHQAGSSYFISPARTHEIIDLPEGEYWSLVFTGDVAREWRHYPELVA